MTAKGRPPIEMMHRDTFASLKSTPLYGSFLSHEPLRQTRRGPQNTEMERLKADLALAEVQAEAAEKLAHERSERIEDLRRILPAPSASATDPKQRHWWSWK